MLDILVVEDEAPIRNWVEYTVSNLSKDYNVVSASNGKEAYELALVLKPQIIISDIQMPVMNGLELTKKIKDVIPNIIVVLLTNYEEFSYAKQAISYGVYEYLIKSDIRPKELGELLEKLHNKIDENKKTSEIILENKEDETNESREEINYSKAIKSAIDYIESNYKKQISLSSISKHVYLSSEYFSRLFKEEVGENFITYLTLFRMKKAEYLIKNTDMKISHISEEVGYSNSGYFSKSYKKYKGISPDEDRCKCQ